jgi:hypothetical protein
LFDDGWYGGDLRFLIPFCSTKVWNSSLVNGVPLSLTMTYGNPCVANILCRLSIVTFDVAEFTIDTSNHFEWASIVDRNIFPWKGPA